MLEFKHCSTRSFWSECNIAWIQALFHSLENLICVFPDGDAAARPKSRPRRCFFQLHTPANCSYLPRAPCSATTDSQFRLRRWWLRLVYHPRKSNCLAVCPRNFSKFFTRVRSNRLFWNVPHAKCGTHSTRWTSPPWALYKQWRYQALPSHAPWRFLQNSKMYTMLFKHYIRIPIVYISVEIIVTSFWIRLRSWRSARSDDRNVCDATISSALVIRSTACA